MTAQIIAAVLLIGFFFILSKAAMGMLGKDHPLAKVFPLGSSFLVAFFLGLMFIGE